MLAPSAAIALPRTLAGIVSSDQPSNPVEALQNAYDRCAPSIYRFFMARTSNDGHTCEDLMQQLWLALASNAARVPVDQLEFWLRGVARNLLNTHWRKRSRRVADYPAASPAQAGRELADRIGAERLPASILEKQEVRDALLLAVTDLPSGDQDLILAHYFEGVPQTELANRLGMSARAIEGRLYRARQALREKLTRLHEDEH